MFFAERAATKIADVPAKTPTRQIASVGVIGAGTMGGGIAMNFLNAGLPVLLLEVSREALDKGVATIRRNYESSVKKNKLSPAELEQRMALLKPTVSYADLGSADLIIEAVFEDLKVKEAVFTKLDAIAKPGAILATNTSTLDVDKIAAYTKRPGDVIGLHFFSPANIMRLLEVVRGKATAKDVLATAMQLAKKIRKLAIVSGVCDGFIGNRMLHRYIAQAGFSSKRDACPRRWIARWRSSVSPWGRFAWATWPATTSAGPFANGAPRRANPPTRARSRTNYARGPLRPEDRRRLVRL